MTYLYIVYGSESKILKELYLKKDAFFIKVYNKEKPSRNTNVLSVNSFDHFKEVFKKCFKELNPSKIIFIGCAFKLSTKIFGLETKQNIQKMINTNIINYIDYTHFLIPYMLRIKSGNFIFLSSFRAVATSKGLSIYSASKSFCEKFFETIGKEYGSKGVYANSIRLGCFDGKMFENISKSDQQKYLSAIGNDRLGDSLDVAKAIDFVVETNYTSGGILELEGGLSYIY